jgi:hypothetical protein
VRRSFWVTVVITIALSLAAVSAAWALPSSLTGEQLNAGVDLSEATPVVTSSSCSSSGGASDFSYSATGTAFGPYPGTFTETGSVTISATATGTYINGIPFFQVASLKAYFTIDSPAGQITGTKSLIVPTNTVFGLCNDFTTPSLYGGSYVTGTFREVCACPDGLAYDATIKTSAGLFEDTGSSGLSLVDLKLTSVVPPGSAAPGDAFSEVFVSSGVVPIVSTAGHVTGGGRIDPAVTFGFNVKSDGGTKGECTVIDRISGSKIKCTNVTAFTQNGTHASFSGNATVNGAPTVYRIDVDDNAEPGAGSDTFKITTFSGYSASGLLTQGNVQIHG